MLKINLAESIHNKFVIDTKTSLDNGSVSTPTEPSVPQTTPSHLEPTLPDPSSGQGSIDQFDIPTMEPRPSTTLQLDLPTSTKTTTPQMGPRPDSEESELSLPAPATGPENEHDNAMSISLETTAHLEGGLVLRNPDVTGMDWHNSTGGWDFKGLGMGDGMGMVSNDINNGLGWGLLEDLMNPNLPLLPESLLPVPALPMQHFISNASPSIFPQPNIPLMQQFLSTASPSNFPQPNILPTQQFLTTPSSSIFSQPNVPPMQQFLSTVSPSISPQPNIPPMQQLLSTASLLSLTHRRLLQVAWTWNDNRKLMTKVT